MSQAPAPGWYPQEDGRQRYWDGQQWTENFAANQGHPLPPQMSPTQPPADQGKKNWFARHKIWTGIGAAAVVLIVVGNLANGGTEPADAGSASSTTPTASGAAKSPASKKPAKKTDSATTKSKTEAESTPGLNTPVRDGKFEFVVKHIDCGKSKVGNEYINQKAQGQFCLVSATVKNIGDESQMLAGSNQYAYDAKGRQFTNDTAAEIMLDDNQTFLQDINPGNTLKGTFVFDVPKNVKIKELELHDSAFSGGIKVKVS